MCVCVCVCARARARARVCIRGGWAHRQQVVERQQIGHVSCRVVHQLLCVGVRVCVRARLCLLLCVCARLCLLLCVCARAHFVRDTAVCSGQPPRLLPPLLSGTFDHHLISISAGDFPQGLQRCAITGRGFDQ